MKITSLLFILALFLSSCKNGEMENLKLQVDSLKRNSYRPGFGEFMSNIQTHHAKLWFAGINGNWELADFEINEIKENLENIQKYQAGRKESQLVIMLLPALDSVGAGVKEKNLSVFKNTFSSLTNTCNDCHRTVNYGFNVVKIPDSPPVSNQVFSIGK